MPTSADATFAAAAELGRLIAENRAAVRQATKDERNARRRARYAATKHLPKPVPVVPANEWGCEDDWEPHCTCYLAAPCGYCTGDHE